MVFNNPDYKIEKINNDNVLSQYYHNLVDDLKEGNRLIILGNSLVNEPHIKSLIKDYYNKEGNTIYLCSRSPNNMHDQIKDIFKYNVVYKETNHIKTIDDLIEFFQDLLTHGR